MSHHARSNQNDATRKDVITDNVRPGTSVVLDVVAPTAAAPLLPVHSEPVKPFDTLIWVTHPPHKVSSPGQKSKMQKQDPMAFVGHCS